MKIQTSFKNHLVACDVEYMDIISALKESQMKKIPQRDVNLSRKLHNMTHQAGLIINILLDPDADHEVLQRMEIEGLENQMFDCISACREYRRKTSPIEVKGQRA